MTGLVEEMSDFDLSCSTTIGIGFSSKSVSLSRAPGWEPESWGFHGDDGHIFASQNVGKHYGEPFSSGDTIGCGVNFGTGSAFFTKNGKFLGTSSHIRAWSGCWFGPSLTTVC